MDLHPQSNPTGLEGSADTSGGHGADAGSNGSSNGLEALNWIGPGTLIDNYLVDRFEFEGGLGRVYRAKRIIASRSPSSTPQAFRWVLLKVYPPNADARLQEAEIRAAGLPAAHFARISDAGSHKDPAGGLRYNYTELEFSEEGSDSGEPVSPPNLYHYISSRKPSLATRLRLAEQFAAAVSCLHRRGYVHSDIKPDNASVRTDNSGQPSLALIDFNLMVRVGDRQASGTKAFASPERNSAGDGAKLASIGWDNYALGLTIGFILSGDDRWISGTPPIATGFDLRRVSWFRCRSKLKELLRDLLRADADKRCTAPQAVDRLGSVRRSIQRWNWVGVVGALMVVLAGVAVVARSYDVARKDRDAAQLRDRLKKKTAGEQQAIADYHQAVERNLKNFLLQEIPSTPQLKALQLPKELQENLERDVGVLTSAPDVVGNDANSLYRRGTAALLLAMSLDDGHLQRRESLLRWSSRALTRAAILPGVAADRLTIDSYAAQALWRLGQVLERQGKPKEAESEVCRAILCLAMVEADPPEPAMALTSVGARVTLAKLTRHRDPGQVLALLDQATRVLDQIESSWKNRKHSANRDEQADMLFLRSEVLRYKGIFLQSIGRTDDGDKDTRAARDLLEQFWRDGDKPLLTLQFARCLTAAARHGPRPIFDDEASGLLVKAEQLLGGMNGSFLTFPDVALARARIAWMEAQLRRNTDLPKLSRGGTPSADLVKAHETAFRRLLECEEVSGVDRQWLEMMAEVGAALGALRLQQPGRLSDAYAPLAQAKKSAEALWRRVPDSDDAARFALTASLELLHWRLVQGGHVTDVLHQFEEFRNNVRDWWMGKCPSDPKALVLVSQAELFCVWARAGSLSTAAASEYAVSIDAFWSKQEAARGLPHERVETLRRQIALSAFRLIRLLSSKKPDVVSPMLAVATKVMRNGTVDRQLVMEHLQTLLTCRKFKEGREAAETALTALPANAPERESVQTMSAVFRVRTGDIRGALAVADGLSSMKAEADRYNRACVYAVAVEKLRGAGDTLPDARILLQKAETAALDALTDLEVRGWFKDPKNLRTLETDHDLDAIRSNPRFASLRRSVNETGNANVSATKTP